MHASRKRIHEAFHAWNQLGEAYLRAFTADQDPRAGGQGGRGQPVSFKTVPAVGRQLKRNLGAGQISLPILYLDQLVRRATEVTLRLARYQRQLEARIASDASRANAISCH